jgi:hypothetical protein
MKKLSKVLGIVLAIVCMMNISTFDVAAATYTEEQLQGDELLHLTTGDVIEFEGTPEITFVDRNGEVLDTYTASDGIITLPDYELQSANFLGWVPIRTATGGGVISEITFRANILPTLSTTTVTEGENVTFSFNVDELPLPHNYTYEWIAGGMAGGWRLDGTTNTTSFTITPDSEYYRDGFIVACRINANGGAMFFTGEAIVDIIPAEVTDPVPEEPQPTPEETGEVVIDTPVAEDVVSTGDTSKIVTYSTFVSLSAIIIALQRKRSMNK